MKKVGRQQNKKNWSLFNYDGNAAHAFNNGHVINRYEEPSLNER